MVVVLCDEGGVGKATASQLAADYQLVTAHPGARFENLGEGRFLVRPDSADDLKQLLKESGAVDSVLHMFALDHPDVADLDVESLKSAQKTGSLSALALVQALVAQAGRLVKRALRAAVRLSGAQAS